jgi:hypothetical protein
VFFKLRCLTCEVDFLPVVATSADELLRPDWNDMEGVNEILVDHLRAFHSQHARCSLDAVESHA